MATIPTNIPFLAYTTLDTFPLSEALTSTVTSPNDSTAVTGAATLFLSEIGGGNPNNLSIPNNNISLGYLWNGSNEYRRVVSVESDTLLFIDSPFTVSLAAGSTVRYIPPSRAMSIGWVDGTAGSTGGGKVNNITLAAGEYEEANVHEFTNRPLQPIIVDGTGGAVHVLASYS